MSTLFDITPYLPILENGHTIVTANARQCAKMRAAYSQHLVTTQLVAPAPRLYSISTWLERMWQQHQLSDCNKINVVLNSLQRQHLWQKIIDADLDALPLVKTEKLYPQADSAFRNLLLWRLPADGWPEGDPVHGLFQTWLRKFKELLAANNWLVPEQKQLILLDAFNQKKLAPTQELHILGFDDIAPLTRCLLVSAGQNLIEHKVATTPNGHITRQQWPNKISEITAAANWARSLLLENPERTIGIISPNLGQVRDQVEQIFIETFELESYDIFKPRYTLPFNFSAGTPLATAPVICDGLARLKLVTNKLPLEVVSALLTSPFWLAGEHTRATAVAINNLFKTPKLQVTAAQVRGAFNTNEVSAPLNALLSVDQTIRHSAYKQNISDWMDFILETLISLGWPGQRRLDSVEYQQVVQFQKLLEGFTSLDIVSQTCSLAEALSQLEKLAQSTPFQAQTPDSSIQILGALEGAALDFDFCWVLNCDNQTWPPPPDPNPLIPVDIQRQNDMPNASASKQLHYAKSLTDRLKQCAPVVVFSNSETDGESELSPSGLISDIELRSNEDILPSTQWRKENERWLASASYLWVDCESAIEVDPHTQQAGGVSVIQWQAAQPFNAFCRFRLNLRPLPVVEHHLPANLRGQITHLALALFWQQVKSQENLLKLDQDSQQLLVEQYVTEALSNIPQAKDYLTPERKTLELERQTSIVNRWLTVERQRPPFVVHSIEESLSASIMELEFKVQFDRIDQLEDQWLIIDYKSGNNSSSKQWQANRLIAPQLPLYACSYGQPIDAVSFAVVNGSHQKFDGIGDLTQDIKGIQGSEKATQMPWGDLIVAWSEDINRTVSEFKNGVTLNHVYDKPTVEYQTDYLAVNRLEEITDNFLLWSQEANNGD